MNDADSSPGRSPGVRRRQAEQDSGSLPDWVWGAGFGLIVMIFIGGFLLFSEFSGAVNACDAPLPTLQQETIDQNGFDLTDAQIGHIIDALNQADVNLAQTILYQTGNVHAYIHSADGQIRTKDVNTGKALCKDLIQFENDLEPNAHVTTDNLAHEADVVRTDLANGAAALGYPKPTST